MVGLDRASLPFRSPVATSVDVPADTRKIFVRVLRVVGC
jgi:hypothetical protein